MCYLSSLKMRITIAMKKVFLFINGILIFIIKSSTVVWLSCLFTLAPWDKRQSNIESVFHLPNQTLTIVKQVAIFSLPKTD